MVRGDAASGNDAVDVGMKLQALIPAMEHAEETDLGTEMPWIAGDFKQSLCTGVEEQVVDEPRSLPPLPSRIWTTIRLLSMSLTFR